MVITRRRLCPLLSAYSVKIANRSVGTALSLLQRHSNIPRTMDQALWPFERPAMITMGLC